MANESNIGVSARLDTKDIEKAIDKVVSAVQDGTTKIATSIDAMVAKMEKGLTNFGNAAENAEKSLESVGKKPKKIAEDSEQSFLSAKKSIDEYKKSIASGKGELGDLIDKIKEMNETQKNLLFQGGLSGVKPSIPSALSEGQVKKIQTSDIGKFDISNLNVPQLTQYVSLLNQRYNLENLSGEAEKRVINEIDKAIQKKKEILKTDRQIAEESKKAADDYRKFWETSLDKLDKEKAKADEKELNRLIKLEAEANKKYETEFKELLKLEEEKAKAAKKESERQVKLKEDAAKSALAQYDINLTQGQDFELVRMREYYAQLQKDSKNYQMSLSEINALEENSVENIQKKVQALQQFQTKNKVDLTDKSSIAENEKLIAQIEELQNKLKQLQTVVKKPIDYDTAIGMSEKSISDRIAKINALKQVQASLSKTDANYEQQLKRVNKAILDLDTANKKAMSSGINLEKETKKMGITMEALTRRMAYYFSVGAITNFAKNLINIRGEFELQNKSLAAIIQNKDEADKLFARITALAVKSPFQLVELVSYTKQLAAYRIETEKLYDTTKMLADVSAGLGVDMNRLILAYGQVKSAAVLRG